jgi:hypothetical protein
VDPRVGSPTRVMWVFFHPTRRGASGSFLQALDRMSMRRKDRSRARVTRM